jgi:arylsulfatase A-like enzyme
MSRLSRRRLFGAGGLGAAGLALGGVAAPKVLAADHRITDDDSRPNALLIISSNTRADFVEAFEDTDDLAKTPNLNALAKESLRFEHAVAEAMPTVAARRAMFTGMRSDPFRDWKRTPKMPGKPGWNPIYEHLQPIVTDVMRKDGVRTAYATDNPFLIGPNFKNFRDTVDDFRGQLSQASWSDYFRSYDKPASAEEAQRYLPAALRGTDEEARMRQYVGWNLRNRKSEDDYSAARVGRDAIDLLGSLRDRQPFFLGVDFFDPAEPFDPPSRFMSRFDVKRTDPLPIQPFEFPYSLTSDMHLDDDAIDNVRRLYAAELGFVDSWIGRVLNELDALGLADNTLVYYLSDHGISLGERGVVGRYSRRAYEEVYRIPYMIRHPTGRRAGEHRRWFASTHDVAPTLLGFMGIRRPGKMTGEDLTCYFEGDEEKPPRRQYFTAAFEDGMLAGNEDWLLATDAGGENKRLYETDEDEDQVDDVLNEHPHVETALADALVIQAGGTLPIFDANHAVRPGPEGGEAFVDRDGDGEPDTNEDDTLKDQRDAQEQGQGNTQGFSGSATDPRFVLTCACGFLLAAKVRDLARREAELHFEEVHPDLFAEMGEDEELLRECPPEEALELEQV